MGKKQRQQEAGPPAAMWIVTFSDCMTLLLCFFVLLLSFSSFTDQTLPQISGSINRALIEWMPRRQPASHDSLVPPVELETRDIDVGSDTRTESSSRETRLPKRPPDIASKDAYRDRRVFHVLSSELFVGRSDAWRPGARRRYLRQIGEFARRVGCRVVVAESRHPTPGFAGDAALERSLAICESLVSEAGVPQGRVGVLASDPGIAGRYGGQPVVQFSLLSRRAGP